jgi:hypothetical protein
MDIKIICLSGEIVNTMNGLNAHETSLLPLVVEALSKHSQPKYSA